MAGAGGGGARAGGGGARRAGAGAGALRRPELLGIFYFLFATLTSMFDRTDYNRLDVVNHDVNCFPVE